MAIVVHLRARISAKRPYGAEQAQAFLQLLEAAPDFPMQIAHMDSAGRPGSNASHQIGRATGAAGGKPGMEV